MFPGNEPSRPLPLRTSGFHVITFPQAKLQKAGGVQSPVTIPPHHIPSHPIASHPTLSHPTLPHPIPSHPTPPYCIPSHCITPHPTPPLAIEPQSSWDLPCDQGETPKNPLSFPPWCHPWGERGTPGTDRCPSPPRAHPDPALPAAPIRPPPGAGRRDPRSVTGSSSSCAHS